MKPTLKQMIKDLESIGRDPTNYRYYYCGKSAKVCKGRVVHIETSPESEHFEKYNFAEVYRVWCHFDFSLSLTNPQRGKTE